MTLTYIYYKVKSPDSMIIFAEKSFNYIFFKIKKTEEYICKFSFKITNFNFNVSPWVSTFTIHDKRTNKCYEKESYVYFQLSNAYYDFIQKLTQNPELYEKELKEQMILAQKKERLNKLKNLKFK